MSTYATTYTRTTGIDGPVVTVNRELAEGDTVRLDVEDTDTRTIEAYLDREEAIALGRALIDAAGLIHHPAAPLATSRARSVRLPRDTALTKAADALRDAYTAGATTPELVVRLLMAARDQSLPGRAEYRLAAQLAEFIDPPQETPAMPTDHARPCEECGTRPGRPMTLAPEGDLTRQRIAYVCEECHR